MNIDHFFGALLFLLVGILGVSTFKECDGFILVWIYRLVSVVALVFCAYFASVQVYLWGQA